MATMVSLLIQNLLGAFSANLDFPNVKTAPVNGTSGSSLIVSMLLYWTFTFYHHFFTKEEAAGMKRESLFCRIFFLPKILGWDHVEKLIVDGKLMYISLVQHPKIKF